MLECSEENEEERRKEMKEGKGTKETKPVENSMGNQNNDDSLDTRVGEGRGDIRNRDGHLLKHRRKGMEGERKKRKEKGGYLESGSQNIQVHDDVVGLDEAILPVFRVVLGGITASDPSKHARDHEDRD